MYTLADYFKYAGITDVPAFFHSCPMLAEKEDGTPIHISPWEHQKEDLKFLMSGHERLGLYNDAGTGKTIPMQAWGIYHACLPNGRTLFCMPPKLLVQFAESLVTTFAGISDVLDVYLLNESQREAAAIVDSWVTGQAVAPKILILSYDMLAALQPIKPVKQKVVTKVDKSTGEIIEIITPAVRPKPVHPLAVCGFNTLVFDEAQKLKSPDSATHKRMWRWLKSTKGKYKVLLATGTPIHNQLIDAYGLIRLVTPYAYGSIKHFETLHAIFDRSQEYKTIVGWDNEELLSQNLYVQARRVTKEMALPNLPPMMPYLHVIKLAPDHRALYKKLLTERVLEVGDEIIDATHQSKLRQVALQLISNPEAFCDTPIVNNMESWLEGLLEDLGVYQNKIIVFAYYRLTIEKLHKKYAHLNPAIINGGGIDSDSERIKFIKDPTCRVLFLNWKSGGAGLNLQVSSTEIFYEVPTVPGDMEQAIARSHRGGQTNSVSVHIPKIVNTIANKSLMQLLSKQLKKNEIIKDKHQILAELLGK
jgi:hypothetical protein